MDWLLSTGQVFGGCCSNVYLFESLLNEANGPARPLDVGSLVTACQFLVVALVSAPSHVDTSRFQWRRLGLRKTQIPLHKLVWLVAMFFVSSVLNNSVWRFGITVPVHIMFRSSSIVITMAVGYCLGGKRYSTGQICSALLMTTGAVLVISQRETVAVDWLIHAVDWSFCFGIGVLLVASFLGALMGLYTEKIYAEHGNHWHETLFYTHLLGIPLFASLGTSVFADLRTVWRASPRVILWQTPRVETLRQFALLVLNCASQVICARGVNQLCGIASSLTVTVVLLVRKFASIAISAYFFGNRFNKQGYVGAAILVAGTIQYNIATLRKTSSKKTIQSHLAEKKENDLPEKADRNPGAKVK